MKKRIVCLFLMVSLLIIGGQTVAISETQFDFSSYSSYSKATDSMDDVAMYVYKVPDTFTDFLSVRIGGDPFTMLIPTLYVRNYEKDDCVPAFSLLFQVDSKSTNTIESVLLKIGGKKTRLLGVKTLVDSTCYICFSPDSYEFLEDMLKQEKIIGRLEGSSFNIDFEIGTLNTELISKEYDRFVSAGGLLYAQNEYDNFSTVLTPVN